VCDPGKNQNISKTSSLHILKAFSLGLEAWLKVVEHLPSKHEVLNSNPSMAKKRHLIRRPKTFFTPRTLIRVLFFHKIKIK
jgi:hypothetical protein